MRPVVNSHYARQLNMWSIPVALTGQQLDARDPNGAILSFDRRDASMKRWPILTPLGLGVASIADDGKLSLKMNFGELKLKELWLDGTLAASAVYVRAGYTFVANARVIAQQGWERV